MKKTLTVAGTVNPAAVIANGVPRRLPDGPPRGRWCRALGDAGSGFEKVVDVPSPASDHSCLRCSALNSSNRGLMSSTDCAESMVTSIVASEYFTNKLVRTGNRQLE